MPKKTNDVIPVGADSANKAYRTAQASIPPKRIYLTPYRANNNGKINIKRTSDICPNDILNAGLAIPIPETKIGAKL